MLRTLRESRFLALLAALALVGCDLPRDPDGTLERARGGVLRVGAAEADSLVVRAPDGSAGGAEAELVAAFARSIDARIEWHWGSSDDLLHRLEKRELDVVVAGLGAKTPWATRVGLTRPWHEEAGRKHVVAVAPGENATLVALDRLVESRRSP